MSAHLFLCEDAHASVFQTIMADLAFILSFTFVDLVNKTILTFHYGTTNQLNGYKKIQDLAENLVVVELMYINTRAKKPHIC